MAGHNYNGRKLTADALEASLSMVVELMHRDIKTIRRLTQNTELNRLDKDKAADNADLRTQNHRIPEWKTLDEKTSDKLCKYAKVFSTMIAENDRFKTKAKKDLEKLDTDELVQLYVNSQKPVKE
jgi:hypothetical protein